MKLTNNIPTTEQARQTECPKCGAKPGEPCANQREGRNHLERARAARAALPRNNT